MSIEVQAVVEETRALCRVIQIESIVEHTNAEKLELVLVDGWQVCVGLKEFKVGEKALYVEIDSLVPVDLPCFGFLGERSTDLRSVNGKPYSRIKTCRFRGELSQGLIVPLPAEYATAQVGENLTDKLGILKYEGAVSKAENSIDDRTWLGKLASWISGPDKTNLLPFPSFLPKTSEPRVQNSGSIYAQHAANQITFQESVKLDGQSLTIGTIDHHTGMHPSEIVCSRNHRLMLVDDVWTLWESLRRWIALLLMSNRRMFRKREWVFPAWNSDPVMEIELSPGAAAVVTEPPKRGFFERCGIWVETFLAQNQRNKLFSIPVWKNGIIAMDDPVVRFVLEEGLLHDVMVIGQQTGVHYALQGELCGPGIQKNHEGLKEKKFFVYAVHITSSENPLWKVGKLKPTEAREFCKQHGFTHVPVLNTHATLPASIKEALIRAEGPRALSKGGQREGTVWEANEIDWSVKNVSNRYLLKLED